MLIDEQEIAARTMPALFDALEAGSLIDFESRTAADLCALFREHGHPGFLVSSALGGDGGKLIEIAHVLRLVGARCPSLAIMMTMHHHSVAGLARGDVALAAREALLTRVAGGALVASAFAEGRPGSDILDSTVRCTPVDGGKSFAVAGTKRPCCMTHHADLAMVGVSVDLGGDGTGGRGIAVVDMKADGIRTAPFWPAEILRSTDSHALTFDGVSVPADCVLAPRGESRAGAKQRMAVAHGEIALSCLFQVMVSASYLGMASRLCELVLQRRGGTAAQRLDILSHLEGATMAVYRLAEVLGAREFSAPALATCVLVSHNTAAQVEHVVTAGARALGGAGYLGSREAQYLVLASRCIEFHPPSTAVKEQIVDGCYTDL